ncbi:dematin-like isoform X7 [Dunckerocampus dactyliophorus]|uniref:dematin-like isoform X7 n=1 Tax=Dunckerocampus dactyliophorus TaxID=161453 RepID=UPI0024074900|nr:dematin-like isoform X7 [Dunckerocampus dactyliophorus]
MRLSLSPSLALARAHTGSDQSAAMMMPKRPQTSPGSVLSLRSSGVPGSPAAAIVARVEDGVIGYKDLAALPRDKAILDIERPDLMMYEAHYTYSPLEASTSLSSRSFSPPASPENLHKEAREWLERCSPGGSSPSSSSRKHSSNTPPSPHTPHTQPSKSNMQHFHTPENGSNIYKKPPIYRRGMATSALPVGKHLEDLIIESSKFPAAQPPDPNLPSKIETDHWPCPPSMAVTEKEHRRSEPRDEDEDGKLDDEVWALRALRRKELNKIQSNLGRIILKEEMDTTSAPLRRKTRSLPNRSQHAGAGTSRSVYFPASSGIGLPRLQSADFSSSQKPASGVQVVIVVLIVRHVGHVVVMFVCLCVRMETPGWTEVTPCPPCWSSRFIRMRHWWSTTEGGASFLLAWTEHGWRDTCHSTSSSACSG